jgi:hypothetical protein
MTRILRVAFTASLLSASVGPAAALTVSEPPRPGTVEAMRCLIHQGPAKCERMFRGRARLGASSWVFPDLDRDFKRGSLLSGSYWGRASDSNWFDTGPLQSSPTKEMDIFDVKFAHVEYTFYISPADADGKIRAVAVELYGPHDPLQRKFR